MKDKVAVYVEVAEPFISPAVVVCPVPTNIGGIALDIGATASEALEDE